jgi:hypothetical protein
MGQPVLRDGIAKGADDMLLAEHIGECLGAILAGENLVTHAPMLACHRSEARGFLVFTAFAARWGFVDM